MASADLVVEPVLLEATRKLGYMLEQKIQAKLSEIWGEEIGAGAQET